LNKTDQLRNIPAVDEILRSDEIAGLCPPPPRRRLTEWVRAAVDSCRTRILHGETLDSAASLRAIIEHVHGSHQSDLGQSIRPVINATGVVLHTNLGRAPLADAAAERMMDAARYANVELNLHSGRRSKRGERVAQLLAQLVDAEDALVVNNCAAATILVLQGIAQGREVIVSRGQLVEIGGGFRLPDVFRSAGVVLREVGTTNRTYLRDYEAAISEQTGAIIRVHRSNFKLTGFVTEPTIDEMVAVERPSDVPVIDDLGSGCIEDLSSLGLDEPTVPASVAAGADLALFSGDKLFGGPQCGIIVGSARWVDHLRKSPMMRALRVDKLTLAGLEATAEIHLAGNGMAEIPVLQMLAASADQIRARCESVQTRLGHPPDISIVACESPVGGGSIPGAELASYALKISSPHADRLAERLRTGSPAIQGRVTEDCLMLDLRTVAESDLETLADRLGDAIGSPKRKDRQA
jgi:L-seryl-tRNA(Ser) seleniumtransferase